MKVDLYGCCVEIPESVELALPRALDTLEPMLRVRIGELPNPTHVYQLDEMVSLSVAPGEAAIAPLAPLGPQALDHYLIDHAVPTGLSCDGLLIVHSACLERNGAAVVFVGPSGAGKSTLSKVLVESGWRLLGDDSIRVSATADGVIANASYAGLRLHTDVLSQVEADGSSLVAEYGSKRRVPTDEGRASATSRAVLMVELGADDALLATPLGPARRAATLASQLFLPPASPGDGMERIGRTTAVAAALAGARVDYPRTFDGARLLADRLVSWLDGEESAGVSWPASS